MSPNRAAFLLLALAGCDASVGNRTERSGEVKVTGIEEVGNNSSAPLEGIGTPAAWRVRDGTAFFGSADQPPQFALRCDRRAQQIVIEQAGSGPAISLTAGEAGGSYTAKSVGNGRLQARVAISDPVLDAMSRSQSQFDAGGLSIPAGVAVRRVLEWCRNPPEAAPDTDDPDAPGIPPDVDAAPTPTPEPTA